MVTVHKWTEFNPRRDVKRPSWFRLDHAMIGDPDFYGFSHEEFVAWIYILGQCCAKNTGSARINYHHALVTRHISHRGMDSALQKLQDLDIVTVDVTDTSRERHANVTDTNATDGRTDGRTPLAEPTNQSGSSRNKKRVKSGIRAVYSPEFEAAWGAYRRYGNKAEAYEAFQEQDLTPDEYQALLSAIPPYLADCGRRDRSQKYFATFLREDWRPWVPAEPQTREVYDPEVAS